MYFHFKLIHFTNKVLTAIHDLQRWLGEVLNDWRLITFTRQFFMSAD